jgi:ATP-binding cassette subfamily C (CFTR/MRP) protein 1
VSAHLIEHCLLGALKHKTRILVTHHLEVAEHADLLIVMDRGRIIQQGPYRTLKSVEGTFRTMIDEYGNASRGSTEIMPSPDSFESDPSDMHRRAEHVTDSQGRKESARGVIKIHMDEEIFTGGICGKTWTAYFKALYKGGPLTIAIFAAILVECSSIAWTFILGFWAASAIPGFQRTQYMGLYAGLGLAVAILSFIGTYTIYTCAIGASFLMAQQALKTVIQSPVSFFDRTPSGRILSRLTKDVEVLDDQLSGYLKFCLEGILSIVGTISLVCYSYPYLAILLLPMFTLYYVFGKLYARTARQLRRINSTMRSYVYSTFGEQQSGLVTIRAFRQQKFFADKFRNALDNEARFFYVIGFLQHWLCLRLDLLGSILIMGIGIFGVCFRNEVAPAKLGVVLVYAMQTTQVSLGVDRDSSSSPWFRLAVVQ